MYQRRNDEIMPSKRLVVERYPSKISQNSIQCRLTKSWNNLPDTIRQPPILGLTKVKNMINEWCLTKRTDN